MVGHALILSLRQFGDGAVLVVLAKSLAVTLAILAVAGIGYWYALRALIDWAGGGFNGEGWLAAVAAALAIVTGWLMFRVVAIAVIGIFADDVVVAVERRHYPGALATARPMGAARAAAMAVRSAMRAVLVNLLVLPVAALLILSGVGAPLLFLLVNGWLLGRDLGDMVAVRHLSTAALPGWRRERRVPRFVLGLGIAALLLVPVLGLIAPILGAMLATHLYHRSVV